MRLVSGREISDAKLEKPFRLIVGGGSGSGKTTFLKNLLDQNHFSSPFDKVVYCYPNYLTELPVEFDQIVEYYPGLCDSNYFSNLPKNTLLIFDDMMNECGNSTDIMKLFSVIARKRNISVIFLVQNVYDNSKQFRNIRLNATGFVLFKFYAATDVTKRLLKDLGVQSLVPQNLLDNIYSTKFAYIFIDVHPERHSEFCTVRSNIFENNYTLFYKMEYVAIPKSEFIKHFKVLEAKKGTIKAVKNEITIRKSGKSKKRKREPTPIESSTSASETTSDTE